MEEMKKGITPTLKKMRVGEMQKWPVERSTSVTVSIGRVQREKRREGVKFSIKTKGLEIEVTRTA